MPELPEVETIRRTLAPRVTGKIVGSVQVLEPRLLRYAPGLSPERLAGTVRGRRLDAPGRRGKYLLLPLVPGPECLLIHLGMTGRLLAVPAADGSSVPGRPAFEHLALKLDFEDEGTGLQLIDPRKFSFLDLIRPGRYDGPPGFSRLGPEPLSPAWTAEQLAASLKQRRAPIKSVLLDQRVVAGLGNIYTDEALFRAGLHPAREARELDRQEVGRLYTAIREVLAEAIAAGGTTFRDYRDAQGRTGEFVRRLRVYGREGKPCPVCGATIERLQVGGRSARFCPCCQARPRGPAPPARKNVAAAPAGGATGAATPERGDGPAVTGQQPSTLVVGLTGGMASGKSAVLRFFREAGARTVDADAIVEELEQPGQPVYQAIVAAFGPEFVSEDGSLDKKRLAGLVFARPAARKKLEEIVHPAVLERLRQEMERARTDGVALLVVEVPLLYELGLEGWFDAVVVVTAPEEQQVERMVVRDHIDANEARNRLCAQMPLASKVKRADWVIDNGGSLAATQEQVNALVQQLFRLRFNRSTVRGRTAPGGKERPCVSP
ncbi:MAG TPA: bifunctional DNA-formamidopyrimidine glycosylase/DNA-(apurinic or apyrimidinic site) lyase [Firmicutes bacterium]|nr:bifunctional DNA-formamidopyrimidine glycosylase/DNA-(apurinic or apyrimidinic site) lyase [Bacillota bacterium]